MRISDWSSDVCSSDLSGEGGGQRHVQRHLLQMHLALQPRPFAHDQQADIFLRLQADDQGVRLQPGPAVAAENGMAHRLELDQYLRLARGQPLRSEERRVGKEGVSTFKTRWSPY